MQKANKDISCGIVESIASFWADHDMEDFSVEIGGKIFSCHSFLLASCSGFFRCLFRSGMKECQEKLVHLQDISVETFQLILKTLYTGCDVLTLENVVDIARAADQLHITFILEHCDKFICNNVSINSVLFKTVYSTPHLIKLRNVRKKIKHFMLENFASFVKTDSFLEVDFDMLLKIVSDRRLEVESEDLVLYSIYKWVEHGELSKISERDPVDDSTNNSILEKKEDITGSSPQRNYTLARIAGKDPDNIPPDITNDRRKHLAQLVGASKLCLVTSSCLLDIYNRELTQLEPKAKIKIFQAITFQMPYYLHGFWPIESEHRYSSDVEHVAVFCNDHSSTAVTLSFPSERRVIPHRKHQAESSQLVVFNKDLYSCDKNQHGCVISFLKSHKWKKLLEVQRQNVFLLAHDKFIYAHDTGTGEISRFDPEETPTLVECEWDIARCRKTKFALSYQGKIIVFCSDTSNDVQTTEVSCWDTSTDTWSRLENFPGSGNAMVSFNHYQDVYILESNGSLWQLTTRSDGVIGFTFLKRVWNLEVDLRGAFLYGKVLVVGRASIQTVEYDIYSELYTSVKVVITDGITSNFVQFVYLMPI